MLRPLVDSAIEVTSMDNAERRVLALTNPDAIGGRNTTTNLNGCLQVLMPGKSARPHRHTPNALRFVLEGNGATTLVDGKNCPMAEGDLIITPGMSWHEHVHKGTAPIVWFDALDVPLHQYLGTAVFEGGPVKDAPNHPDDSAFAVPNIVPELPDAAHRVFAGVPLSAGGLGRGAALGADREGWIAQDSLRQSDDRRAGDVAARLLHDPDRCRRRDHPVSHHQQFGLRGRGGTGTEPGGQRDLRMGSERHLQHAPRQLDHASRPRSKTATLFVVNDREVLRRLDLLAEEYGNERR